MGMDKKSVSVFPLLNRDSLLKLFKKLVTLKTKEKKILKNFLFLLNTMTQFIMQCKQLE